MKIVFLGVGEATDETLPNNSHIVLSKINILLDCGYSIPRELWKYDSNPDFLDAIYISHPHADHYFGLPAYLIRLNQDGRKKLLTIICHKKLISQIKDLLEFGYKGTAAKYGYEIKFIEAKEGEILKFNEVEMEFAPTMHSVKNFAVRVSDGKKVICYSGDGMFVDRTENLYREADLVVHESFTFDEKVEGHAIVTDLVSMAQRNGIKCLALTHIRRDVRKDKIDRIKKYISGQNIKVILPEPLEEYSL
jgi:ribonuclease Z